MRDRIDQALKEAIKSQDKRRLSTLRLMNAAIKDRDIAARGADKVEGVSDDEILEILAKMVKQRIDAAQTYKDAARADLEAQELEEIKIIQEFLPRQLSEEEAREVTATIIAEIKASGLKDMGKVMGELKSRYTGQMDFGKASGWVKQFLG